MASIQNNNETMHLVKFRTGKIDTFKNAEAVPLDAGTLYFAHSDLNIAESDNEEGEGRPYKNAPYGYIVYDVPNMDGATRVVMGDHARITTYLENPIWLHIGGSDDNPDAGASICLQGRASDKDENLADVLGSKGKPFTLSYTDIGADLSSNWTWGRSEGPILNLTVNGVPHTVAAIPAATGETLTTTTTNADGEEISTEYKGISGIVTTEVQSFAGAKTFKAPLTIDLPETFTGGGVAGEEGIGDYAFAIKTNDDQPNSLEFNMRRASKGEAFSLYSLTVNNTTKLQNKTYYTLSLGSQFKFLAAENPDQKGVHEVGMGLGNVIHLISTNLSTDAQTSITTDLTKLTDKELITPFYEKNTIKREKGKLLSVGEDEDGLLTPYSVTLGTTTQPIYFADGAPTSCAEYAGGTRLNINGTEYTKEATIYAPLSAPTNSTTKWTVGWDGTQPYWMDSSSITPAALGKNAGSATQPIYFADGGVPTPCSFQILSGDPIWSSSYKVLGLKQGTSNSDEVLSYAASDCLGCIFIDTTRNIVYISNGLIWEGMNTYQ